MRGDMHCVSIIFIDPSIHPISLSFSVGSRSIGIVYYVLTRKLTLGNGSYRGGGIHAVGNDLTTLQSLNLLLSVRQACIFIIIILIIIIISIIIIAIIIIQTHTYIVGLHFQPLRTDDISLKTAESSPSSSMVPVLRVDPSYGRSSVQLNPASSAVRGLSNCPPSSCSGEARSGGKLLGSPRNRPGGVSILSYWNTCLSIYPLV